MNDAETDDAAPATYLPGSESDMLRCIADELAELRRLTARRNEMLGESTEATREQTRAIEENTRAIHCALDPNAVRS